jgi:hypothetical protein
MLTEIQEEIARLLSDLIQIDTTNPPETKLAQPTFWLNTSRATALNLKSSSLLRQRQHNHEAQRFRRKTQPAPAGSPRRCCR